jgi:hypothetical protein
MSAEVKSLLWFAVLWAILLTGGLGYYLIRSLKRKTITLIGRSGGLTFSRDSRPIGYWVTFVTYSLLLPLIVFMLNMRIQELLKRSNH